MRRDRSRFRLLCRLAAPRGRLGARAPFGVVEPAGVLKLELWLACLANRAVFDCIRQENRMLDFATNSLDHPAITRHRTRITLVGGIPVGGGHPIVVQSMTNTDTADIAAT